MGDSAPFLDGGRYMIEDSNIWRDIKLRLNSAGVVFGEHGDEDAVDTRNVKRFWLDKVRSDETKTVLGP